MLLKVTLLCLIGYVAAQSQAEYVTEACARNPSLSFCRGALSDGTGPAVEGDVGAWCSRYEDRFYYWCLNIKDHPSQYHQSLNKLCLEYVHICQPALSKPTPAPVLPPVPAGGVPLTSLPETPLIGQPTVVVPDNRIGGSNLCTDYRTNYDHYCPRIAQFPEYRTRLEVVCPEYRRRCL